MATNRVTSVTKVGSKAWKYEWAGTSPFRLYTPGWQIGGPTTDTSIIVEGDDEYEPPVLQVLDSTDTEDYLDLTYPSTIVLQWRGDASHAYYVVQENISATWTHRRIVRESGQGYYEFKSPALADVTQANWRVIAYDSQENAGRSMEFTILVVRNPAAPSVNMTYNPSTGNATVSER